MTPVIPRATHHWRRLLTVANHCIKEMITVPLSTSRAQIELSAKKVLVDEKVNITVHGLNRGQKVTLQSFMKDGDKSFGACGHYVAKADGTVDVQTDTSVGGTFQGVEPMGLFWSMKTTPGVKPGRLLKEDITTPLNVTVSVQDGFTSFDDLPWSSSGPCLVSCDLQRFYMSEGVRRIPVSENGIFGTLFVPPGDGPFPALIDIFGMTGGIKEHRSALLASHGFASFTIVYVDHENLPKKEKDLDFNYFLKAFDWLAAHPLVNQNAIGGISLCVGGGYLCFIASRRPMLKWVVTINGTFLPIGPEHTVEGQLVQPGSFAFERAKIIDDMMSFKYMFEDKKLDFFGMWQHGAKFLCMQGLDDQCVHPHIMEAYKSEVPAEYRDNHTFICYPGAGHLIEPPYIPLCRTNYNSIFRMKMFWGGEPKQHADAQEDSWRRTLQFLNECVHNNNINQPRNQDVGVNVQ